MLCDITSTLQVYGVDVSIYKRRNFVSLRPSCNIKSYVRTQTNLNQSTSNPECLIHYDHNHCGIPISDEKSTPVRQLTTEVAGKIIFRD